MILPQIANGIALQLVLAFMPLLVNREELMDDQVNGRMLSAVA
jgi:Mn2+/Fe2+ NRAMP family transporter